MPDNFKPLKLQAYDFLKKLILEGDILPGIIYSETKIAAQCNVSRTPMRDAIQVLSQEGYIDIIPSKGFSLHSLNEKDLLDLYQIRCALEGFCVVQLTQNIHSAKGSSVLKSLQSLLTKQEEVIRTTRSIKDFTKYDTDFHNKIVHSLENSSISAMFDNYHFQLKEQTMISLRRDGRLDETLIEHTNILESIKSGDFIKSYNSILYHLEQPKAIILLQKKKHQSN